MEQANVIPSHLDKEEEEVKWKQQILFFQFLLHCDFIIHFSFVLVIVLCLFVMQRLIRIGGVANYTTRSMPLSECFQPIMLKWSMKMVMCLVHLLIDV